MAQTPYTITQLRKRIFHVSSKGASVQTYKKIVNRDDGVGSTDVLSKFYVKAKQSILFFHIMLNYVLLSIGVDQDAIRFIVGISLPEMLSPMFTTFCTILPLLPIGISHNKYLITSVKRVTSSNVITYQPTGLHMIMNICQSPRLV